METLKSRAFNVQPGQTFNGEEVTTLSEGNILYIESDVRGGNQVGFITSKPFDFSSVTNVVMSFSSLYEQNQDNIGAVEYSVDGGTSWLPLLYYIDALDGGGDIIYRTDGTVDAVTTLTRANADTANWTENGVDKGDKYGDAILAPITSALDTYIAPRSNDNPTIDKLIEVVRLPQAGGKNDVRLRFSYIGTGSWYWGVDNIAFYEGPASTSTPGGDSSLTITKSEAGQINLSWTGSGTLESADAIDPHARGGHFRADGRGGHRHGQGLRFLAAKRLAQRHQSRSQAKYRAESPRDQADHRNRINEGQKNGPGHKRQQRCLERLATGYATQAPAEKTNHPHLADDQGEKESDHHKWNRGNTDHRDREHDRQGRCQNHGQKSGDQRGDRAMFERGIGELDSGRKENQHEEVKKQSHRRGEPWPRHP